MCIPAFQVHVLPGDWVFEAPASQSVLRAAEGAGVIIPSSCRNGTCRTCITLATRGSVRYNIEWPGLSAEEKAEGWILPCVAHATSNLELDAPAAAHFAQEAG